MLDEQQSLLWGSLRKPELTTSQRGKYASWTIIIAIGLERMAFYTVSDNLIVFLTKPYICWSNHLINTMITLFIGLTYCIGPFSGWLSDSYVEQYCVILAGYVFYIAGCVLLVVQTYQYVGISTSNLTRPVLEGSERCNVSLYIHSSSHSLEFEQHHHLTEILLFSTFILISLASGIVRTTTLSFGGEQVK